MIQLADGRGVETFIAPPAKSKPWFNRIYEETMGRSFRFNEQEYAIYAKNIRVRVIAIKRK